MVLPAPFWPTMASDDPAGIVRSKPSSTGSARGRVGEGDVATADLSRRHAGGCPACRGPATRRAPSPLEAASTAAAGAAAPSSAHDNPPKAIMLVIKAAVANVTTRSSASEPSAAALASDQNTTMFAASTSSKAPDDRALAEAGGLPAQLEQSAAARSKAVHGPSRKPEEPQFLGREWFDRQAVGVVGVALRLADFLGIAVAPDAAFAQAASACPASRRQAAAAPTTRSPRARRQRQDPPPSPPAPRQ